MGNLLAPLTNNASLPGISIITFGADPTGVADSTSSINAAITAASNSVNKIVYIPAGVYKVTSTLNFTYSGTSNNALSVTGDGIDVSILDFSTATGSGVCVDYSGNTGGRWINAQARVIGNACTLSASFLGAKNTNNSTGNDLYLQNARFMMPTSNFNVANICGLNLAKVDRCILDNVYGYGPTGMVLGPSIAGVSSSFQTPAVQFDWTQCSINNVVGIGSTGPGLITAGCLNGTGDNYFAIINSGTTNSSKIIDVNTFGQAANSAKSCSGYFRTENQTGGATTGVTALKFTEAAQGWFGSFDLTTDSAGASIGGSLGSSNITVSAANPLFDATAIISLVVINCPETTALGTPSSATNITIIGGSTVAQMQQYCTKWTLQRSDGTWSLSADHNLYTPNTGQVEIQPVGFDTRTANGTTAYTTAPAQQLVWTWTVQNGIAITSSIGGNGAPGANFRIDGNCNGGAAGGRLVLQAVQGANTVTLIDSGTNIAGGAQWSIAGEIYDLGTNGNAMRAYCQIIFGTQSECQSTNLQASSILGNANMTLNLYWTNANNSSISLISRKSWRG